AFHLLFPDIADPALNVTACELTELQRSAIPVIIETIKRARRKSQGTGYSQLLEGVRRTRSDVSLRSRFLAEAARCFGKPSDVDTYVSGSTETIRLGFQELRNGPSTQLFSLKAIEVFSLLYEISSAAASITPSVSLNDAQ